MGTFNNPDQFFGTWHGSWDGRSARLEIGDYKDDGPVWHCHITLIDGTAKFRADRVRHDVKPGIFRDVTLKGIDGTVDTKEVKLLQIHTWNDDWISGFSMWHGTESGFAFQRFWLHG